MAQVFYRVDEWHADNSGSKHHFCPTAQEAIFFVSGMEMVELSDTEGIEYTTIQPFEADTCDMQGWYDSEMYDPQFYVKQN